MLIGSFSNEAPSFDDLQLRDRQSEPLLAVPLESNLRARIGAAAFERRDGALAEFRMEHLLADTKARIGRALFIRERR